VAKCSEISGRDDLSLSLIGPEVDFVEQHAKAFGMGFDDAVADIVEFGFLKMGESCVSPALSEDESGMPDGFDISVTINYPKDGVWSNLTAKDRAFLQAMMNVSLREAITMVMYQRMSKGTPNELG